MSPHGSGHVLSGSSIIDVVAGGSERQTYMIPTTWTQALTKL